MDGDALRRLAVVLFLAVQVLIPVLALAGRLATGDCMPFGWQMYACSPG